MATEQRSPLASLALASLGIAVGIASLAALILPFLSHGHSHRYYEDTNNCKQMVVIILQARKVYATEDGRIDVYRTVFDEIALVDDNAKLLGNVHLERTPTVAEIRSGDYTNFAWGRALVSELKATEERIPLLWYAAPYEGHRIVGYSDGAIRVLTEDEFRALDCDE